MIGISSESFIWITHFLLTISRIKPKINLKKLIMKNEYLSKGNYFEIQQHKIEFRMEGTGKYGSIFINVLIRKMIIEWYFILFLSCFIYIISEVKINYNVDLDICMFILFFIFIFYKRKYKINIYKYILKKNCKIIIIKYV
jgi:hypothetical protein